MKIEDYVTFEVAKLLKEKGFMESTNAYFKSGKFEWCLFRDGIAYNSIFPNNDYCSAPSLAQAAKWLRDAHKKAICILPYCFHWNYNIYDLKEVDNDCTHKILGARVNWETYEQALNEGIKEALKMI